MIDRIRPFGGFDYVQEANPTIDVDPGEVGVSWLNTTTGEIFVCISSVIGENVWKGQMGTTVSV